MIADQRKSLRIMDLARRLKHDLAAFAAKFEEWRDTWRSQNYEPPTPEIRYPRHEKWDGYQRAFITDGPKWEALAEDPRNDLAEIMLNHCIGHVSGHPGPVAEVHLLYAVKVLFLRPDLIRGRLGDFSLLLCVQGLVQDHAVPDGILPREELVANWRGVIVPSICSLMTRKAIREEYERVTQLMNRCTDHPLRKGFLRAVELVEAMMREFERPTFIEFHRTHAVETLRLGIAA